MFMETFRRIHVRDVHNSQKNPLLRWLFGLVYNQLLQWGYVKNYYSLLTPVVCYGSYDMSLVVRKPALCICENKDADQLRSNCAADQRLCIRHIDSTIPLLSKSGILRPGFSQRGSYSLELIA